MGFHTVCASSIEKISANSDVELETIKIQAQENFLKALGLSLYYQGWDISIFDSLKYYNEPARLDAYDDIIANSELIRTRSARDSSESFKWAAKAYGLKPEHPLTMANLAAHYIAGLGTEKDFNKAAEIIYAFNEKPGPFNPSGMLIAYLNYKQPGSFKELKIPEYPYSVLNWRNFYIGLFAPKDSEFVIHMLKSNEDETVSEATAANALWLIYEGRLDPKDKNVEEAKRWKVNFEYELERRKVLAVQKRINYLEYAAKTSNLTFAQRIVSEKIFLGWFLDGYRDMPDPFYNPDLFEKMILGLQKGNDTSFRVYRTLMRVHLSENGETEYSRKYYELAKKYAKSPSELDELEKLRKSVLRSSNIKCYEPLYWFDIAL